ncbi:hypothetical protein MMC10_008410 [Thelotrema lepadinum]|nr:hypothetical protein [Thelotrema lepadinum]
MSTHYCRSNPTSSRYGQHWTSDEILNVFSPSETTYNATSEWLIGSGISKNRISYTANRATLAFDATAEEIEALLDTQYFLYHHAHTQDQALACDQYNVPAHMEEHIDFITPGIGLSKRSKSRKEPQKLAKRQFNGTSFDSYGQNYTLADCSNGALPQCISTLYNIPPQTSCHPDNSLGIFEFNATYVQDDMDLFFKYMAPQIPVGTAADNNLINGAKTDPSIVLDGSTYTPALESNLDFQIAWPLMYPQNLTLFSALMTDSQLAIDLNTSTTATQFGSLIEDDAIDDLASALDASYCTGSSNSPCGVLEAPKVLSISYGNDESDVPPAKTQRLCNEFLKLGLQGTTILVGSGDGGVASHKATCIGPQNNTFDPQFPASCPWVTTVGGTMLNPDGTLTSPEVAAYTPYPPDPTEDYATSGGFSNHFSAPSYQTPTLARYFYQSPPPYPSYNYTGPASIGAGGGRFNRLGRGIPDVSALSLNITTVQNGSPVPVSGTSASTPIFASIVARINNERLKAGKSSVGFINPVLYANPQALRDLVLGSTVGCNTTGFGAGSGWDPATGLGTPDYTRMLALFMSLP